MWEEGKRRGEGWERGNELCILIRSTASHQDSRYRLNIQCLTLT